MKVESRREGKDEIKHMMIHEGFTWRPNAKINMGLGRAWE